MTRLTVFFALLLVLSGLSLVSSQYRARQLFIDLDHARNAARKLDIEWRTLQLEQTNYSKPSLIEAAAQHDLKMLRPTSRRIEAITLTQRPVGVRELRAARKPDGAPGEPVRPVP